jgi:hypothetical protein
MSDALRFTVYFDGTGNSKDLNQPEGNHTNVARLYDLDTAKGTNLSYNSGTAPLRYDAQERSGQSEKVYFDGVGSQANISPRSLLEGGAGLGGQQRIDQAYEAIVAFHNKYPEQPVAVNIVGFSRGAAQARALANEFIERGVPKRDAQGRDTGAFLIPPGQAHVNKLGIFDTVASFGNAYSDVHLGKDLAIGKHVDSTTHLVAMNEYRDTFRLTSALRNDDNSRIEELRFAGAHSQVGGGYRNDVLAAGPLAVMYGRLQAAGIELQPMRQEDVQRVEQYNELIKSPERVHDALIDSRIKAGNEAFTRSADGAYQVVDNTPFPMQKGTLNVFARQNRPFEQEANGRGVIFESDDSLSKSKVQRGVEAVGDWFAHVGDKLKDRAAQFFGKYSNVDEQANVVGRESFALKMQKMQEASAMGQGQELETSLTSSRPDSQYIRGLNLQAVPLPQNTRSSQQADPYVQQRSDSFKAMEEKAQSHTPSATVGEASQGGRRAVSGLVVAMDDHHILQKVGQTSEFVIHDRRDCDPNRTYQVGKSTAIVNDRAAADLARSLPKLEQDLGQGKALRR